MEISRERQIIAATSCKNTSYPMESDTAVESRGLVFHFSFLTFNLQSAVEIENTKHKCYG